MIREFTATVYIIKDEKVILIYHRKLRKWLPPGGHVEPNETPSEAAIREALEETGFHIDLLMDEHITIDNWNAKSIARPLLCLLEEIPEYNNHPAHQHMDFVFAAKPVSQTDTQETQEWRWFSLDEIRGMETDVDVFTETKNVVAMIFNKFASVNV